MVIIKSNIFHHRYFCTIRFRFTVPLIIAAFWLCSDSIYHHVDDRGHNLEWMNEWMNGFLFLKPETHLHLHLCLHPFASLSPSDDNDTLTLAVVLAQPFGLLMADAEDYSIGWKGGGGGFFNGDDVIIDEDYDEPFGLLICWWRL